MRIQTCPKPTALTSIPAISCPENFSQVQKLIFRRRSQPVISAANMILLATWTAFKAASDATKVIITPFIEGTAMEPGKMKEFGSGNDVRNGIPLNMGTSFAKFTWRMNQYTADIIAGFRPAMDEDLEVFLVNEFGWFGCLTSGASYIGIPIQSLFISDRVLGGLEAPDYYEGSFSLAGNWSANWKTVNPTVNFSALDL